MKKFTILEEESGMHSPPALFVRACLKHEKIIGQSVKNVLWYSRDGHFKWGYILDEIYKVGNLILKRILNDGKFSKIISAKIRSLSSQLHNFSKETRRIDLNGKNNKFLSEIYNKYCQILEELYFWGSLIELMEVHYNLFSGFLKKELKRVIRQRNLNKSSEECLLILTILTEKSFAKKQEKDFLKLASEISKSKKLKETIGFDKKINQHLNTYCWINYNYEGPAMDKEFLVDLLGHAINTNPNKKLKEIETKTKADKQSQEKLIRDLKPDKQLKHLIELAKEFPTLKMIRKESIFHSCYAVDKIRIEISKRLGISLNQCRTAAMFPEEITKALELNKINKAELKARKKEMTYFLNNGKEEIYTGQKARRLAEENIIEEKPEKLEKIKGNPACLGRASGAVKIIKSTKDISKMKQGNILVAMATNPTFVPAMKKAAAIITDMGGITCHAAIVSRELNIPCIIGTKIATKVLKDGDLVEVDADKGIVKIINKAK